MNVKLNVTENSRVIKLNVTENSRVIKLVLSGTGVRGAAGPAGTSAILEVTDSVANAAALPAAADHENEFWLAEDTGVIWYSNGTAWIEASIGSGVVGTGDLSDGDTLTTGLTFPIAGLHLLDTNASHDLILSPGSDLTADRTLTLTTGDANRTLTLTADASVGGTNTGDQDLSGYVAKATFNANTILAATEDNTPAALTVAEQTLVGRITSGAIDDLSATQVRTLLNVADGATAAGAIGDAFASSHPGGNQHIDWTSDQGATDIHAGNIPDLSVTYATAAKGVTNGDSHDHNGGDGAQIAYSTLSGLPTLGDAAALSVGTTAGTVAAGDDSRFTAITAVGSGVNFFPTDTAIIAASANNTYPVKTLSDAPSGAAEDVDSIVIEAGTTVMYGSYLSPVLLNTQIDGGIWEFHVYAGVDSAVGVTTLTENIYRVRPAVETVTITGTGTSRTCTASAGTPFATANIDASAAIADCSFVQTPLGLYPITARTSDTVVTITTPTGYTNESAVSLSVHKKLFGVTSAEIDALAGTGPDYTGIVLLPEMISVQVDIPLVAGDRLATSFLGTSTSLSSRTLYFVHDGTTRYSHFHTPLTFVVDLASGVSGVLPVANGGTGGTALPKLDDLTEPDDNTDLNASTTKHGLLLKATAPASGLLSVVGIGNTETAYTNKALFDTTNPAALGTAGPGTQIIAARRDHIHALPAIDATAAATDITTRNVTTSVHGLAPKAVAPAAGLINFLGIANGETTFANKALFDTTNPADLGTAAPGTSLIAARRDHVHNAPAGSAADIDQYDVAARLAAGAGAYAGVATADLTEETTPAAGDFLLGWESGGALRKFDVGALPAGSVADGSITLAKMANLAQDQFIGRVTASTGVPETATITAAGRALLDDATAADQRTTLGLGTAAVEASTAFAAALHSHAASDITSGTVATARLGAGTASAGTLLRGDQTWATYNITADTTIYVETTGSDTTGDGTSVGTAFLTLQKAFDSLTDKLIAPTATVTISCGAGDHLFSVAAKFQHPSGSQIVVNGQTPTLSITGIVEADFTDPLNPVPGTRGAYDLYNSAGMLATSALTATRTAAIAQDKIDNEALLRTVYPTRFVRTAGNCINVFSPIGGINNILFIGPSAAISITQGTLTCTTSLASVGGTVIQASGQVQASLTKAICVGSATTGVGMDYKATVVIETFFCQGAATSAIVVNRQATFVFADVIASGGLSTVMSLASNALVISHHSSLLRKNINLSGNNAGAIAINGHSIFAWVSSGISGLSLNISGNVGVPCTLSGSSYFEIASSTISINIITRPESLGVSVVEKSQFFAAGSTSISRGTHLVQATTGSIAQFVALTTNTPTTSVIRSLTGSVVKLTGALTCNGGVGSSGFTASGGGVITGTIASISTVAAAYPTNFIPPFGQKAGDGSYITDLSLSDGVYTVDAAGALTLHGTALTTDVLAGTGTRLVTAAADGTLGSTGAVTETTITFTDVTTGNASTTAHGFSPKATAPAAGLINVLAIGNGQTVRSDQTIFDGLVKVVSLTRAAYIALGPGRPATNVYLVRG